MATEMTEPQGHCVGCKHWDEAKPDWGGTYPGDEVKVGRWGSCEFILMVEKTERRTETGDYVPVSKSERAALADGSGYWAGLNTRADFGCVEFEAR